MNLKLYFGGKCIETVPGRWFDVVLRDLEVISMGLWRMLASGGRPREGLGRWRGLGAQKIGKNKFQKVNFRRNLGH